MTAAEQTPRTGTEQAMHDLTWYVFGQHREQPASAEELLDVMQRLAAHASRIRAYFAANRMNEGIGFLRESAAADNEADANRYAVTALSIFSIGCGVYLERAAR